MRDVRVDEAGDLRCWNCGAKAFTEKRTFRAKALGAAVAVTTVGIAAAAPLATKKKLRCTACGSYNDVGSAKPWTPANTGSSSAAVRQVPTPRTRPTGPSPTPTPSPQPDAALAAMRSAHQLEQEKATSQARARVATLQALVDSGLLSAHEAQPLALTLAGEVPQYGELWRSVATGTLHWRAYLAGSALDRLAALAHGFRLGEVTAASWEDAKTSALTLPTATAPPSMDPLGVLPEIAAQQAAGYLTPAEADSVRLRLTPASLATAQGQLVPAWAAVARVTFSSFPTLARQHASGDFSAKLWSTYKARFLDTMAQIPVWPVEASADDTAPIAASLPAAPLPPPAPPSAPPPAPPSAPPLAPPPRT